ncbi:MULTISPECIES: phosphogluconate dehydratase [Gammaproteobacteria]|uniref:phosphogluconate dehydratase n=1 Tax=Gammaproteobacteria TaxID=1236 RepID=UPI000DD033BE|nr:MULTISPECIES: phosphogluconate dehydratase [Gammaproteobacteria]RTE86281.1 phosphogluconate dehydratase [Aliidiomarina sp. B3213]TCZ91632.1 phosphogluconate dehydratase [Lysobacter sp. N42]
MHPVIERVQKRIEERSQNTRKDYMERMAAARQQGPHRGALSCGNLAHGFAACGQSEKTNLRSLTKANIGIVTSYNDMLSAHQPYHDYPQKLKQAIHDVGSVAQVAGGVPAMCDGVTQGQPGMELSLMSRDVIAMATAVSLSHNMFDGGLMLGICDKIVPGLLIGALSFGHLPFVFVPAGPMPSGITNKQKARVRELYAEGKIGKEELLDAESASYHSPGTCTFYGTANSNQLIVEIMGLQLPGSSFVNPGSELREELTRVAAQQVTRITDLGTEYTPISEVVDAKAIVNGLVGLLATGGSTNHTMHLVAIARAAGFVINWDDFAELSSVVPLVTRIYPNGEADINHFQRAGGMAFLIHTLLEKGLLFEDVNTVAGFGLSKYTKKPVLVGGQVTWEEGPKESLDTSVLRSAENPFSDHGGLAVLSGNLGRAVIKTSAIPEGKESITAPAVVMSSQHELDKAFKAGELDRDCIVVVRFQGPKAIGMPELHKLTPPLSVLQKRGFNVALVTDGRMSGASGAVPAAIHVTPEAVEGGLIGKVQHGDMIKLDPHSGTLELLVDASVLEQREQSHCDLSTSHFGMGRELFNGYRGQLSGAEEGACGLLGGSVACANNNKNGTK